METRADTRAKANVLEAMWAESERCYHERRREEHREEWVAFHMSQAERIETTARELAEGEVGGASGEGGAWFLLAGGFL